MRYGRVVWKAVSELYYRGQLWVLRQIFRGSYSRFYRQFMRLSARRDPKAAVGGLWEELGRLQFDFLRNEGLCPHHRLLDIGCGALRAGVHFIGYLAPGHYTGIDISEHILEAGSKMLPAGLLRERRPRLLRNRDLLLREFEDASFDFVLAQSVFTHMPLTDVQQCIASLPRVLRENGRFYFTIFEDQRERYVSGAENFYYPPQTLDCLCRRSGLQLTRVDEFVHPRHQAMFRAAKKPDGRDSDL